MSGGGLQNNRKLIYKDVCETLGEHAMHEQRAIHKNKDNTAILLTECKTLSSCYGELEQT